MLLTLEQMDFLGKVTVNAGGGKLRAKEGLTPAEKKRLLAIDKLNLDCYDEHWVVNYESLMEEETE